MGRIRELLVGVIMVALAVAVWVHAQGFPVLRGGHPGPALFPQAVSIFLGLSGLLLGATALRQGPTPSGSGAGVAWGGLARALMVVVLATLYPLVQQQLGFIPTVSLLSFGVAFLLRAPLLPALLTSVVGTVLIYWLFTRLLGVPL
jgi:putative tricarboxylic transport membrane protein